MTNSKAVFNGLKKWWHRFLGELEQPTVEPRFRFVRWVVVPLLVVAALTAFARFAGFDLRAEKAIYVAGGNSWAFGEVGLWKFLYQFGTFPASGIVLLSAITYLASWSMPRFRKWRRVYLFIILSFAVSSGVITNVVLKEFWGRPRPKQVLGMGGHQKFEEALDFHSNSKGKSFPCGHATTGFFFVGGFFLLRRRRRDLARGFLIFGMIFGALMGLARMTQGAHFFTDVVWAGAVSWFTAMGLFYALKLDRSLVGGVSERAMPCWLKIVTGAFGVALLVGVLLGTPYREKRDLFIVEDFAKSGPLDVSLTFLTGDILMKPGAEFHLTGEAWGHGLPISGIGEGFVVVHGQEASRVIYVEDLDGWFMELESKLKVILPWKRIRSLTIAPGQGEIELHVPEFSGKKQLRIEKGNSRIRLKMDGKNVRLRGKAVHKAPFTVEKNSGKGEEGRGILLLKTSDDFHGTIEVEATR